MVGEASRSERWPGGGEEGRWKGRREGEGVLVLGTGLPRVMYHTKTRACDVDVG